MSTIFPAMISNEPPPLDSSDGEDNDEYIEFRTGGLKLDVLGDPSPICSPRRHPNKNTSNDSESPSQIHISRIDLPESAAHVNNEDSEPGNQKYEKKVETETDAAEELEGLSDINSPEIPNGISCQAQRPLEDGSLISTLNSITLFKNSENAICTSIEDPEPFQSSEKSNTFLPFSSDARSDCLGFTNQTNDTVLVDEKELWDLDHERLESGKMDEQALHSSGRRESSSTLSSDENPAQQYSETHCVLDEFPEFDSIGSKNVDSEERQQEEFTPTVPSSSSDFPDCSTPDALDFEDSFPNQRGIDPNRETKDDDFGITATVLSQDCDPIDFVEDDWRPFEDAVTNSATVLLADCDDDDFGDFTSSELTETLPTGTTQTQVQPINILGEDRFEVIIKSLFGQAEQQASSNQLHFKCIDSELKNGSSNKTWSHVEEFEDSYGLVFKWATSGVYQHLLKSLNVDPSTILYSGKWGSIEVPKFAASLVDTPLQPQASFKPSQAETEDFYQNPPKHNSPASSSQSPGGESSNSGFGEPEDKVEVKLSMESTKILEQLPDLSYMRAKTLVFPRNPKY